MVHRVYSLPGSDLPPEKHGAAISSLNARRPGPAPAPSHLLSSAVIAPALAESIVEGTLAPGTRLSEAELSERFGVSRTPVREALAQLERDGLVVNVARVGAFVRTLDLEDVDELYEARMALEVFAVQRVAERLTNVGRARIDEVIGLMRERVAVDDAAGYTAELDRFYAIVMEIAGNPTLRAMHDSLRGPGRGLRRIAMSHERRMHESFEHAALVANAMLAGDGATAARAMHDQLTTARDAAKDVLQHTLPARDENAAAGGRKST